MKSNFALGIAFLSLLLNILFISGIFNKKKIAYVRSTELVYGYLGMQEAQRDFQQKSQIWQANVDTLQQDYQVSFSKYSSESATLSKDEKTEREKILIQQQESLMNYTQTINAKMKEEDKKTTEGVLNQINSFVEEYGKENGYEVILGTTLSGNLLYGDEAIDITKEVLEELNKTYKGEIVK